MLRKKWKFKNSVDETEILALADSLHISNVLAKLLIQRGITSFFDAKTYFRPSLENLYDPFLMDGMEEASHRVIKAITSNEKITIYGDYDVDGTCASAVMYLFLKKLGANVEVYIPHRLTEGYGISKTSIENLSQQSTSLLIAVDCGITAVEEIEYAKQLGMDTIICDHHHPKVKIPDAYAVLDPLKPNCNYPFKYLSGAGVAFKLARAVGDLIGQKETALELLDLVALAGAADIVPLVDENRTLVKKGIELINENPRPGIKALIESANMNAGNLSAGQVVFTLAPRINAVGRLGEAFPAVKLFITEDEEEAKKLAQILENENYQRRKIDEMTFTHALQIVEETMDLNEDIGIVLHDENWHPGVIGIVASRLVEKYYRPAIMLTTIDGIAKGSARSVGGFNIYEAIEECSEHLIQFGGHEAAAGLEMKVEKIEDFRKCLNQVLREKMTVQDILPEITIDAKLSFSEITPKFMRILEQFAPFGPVNMRPTFVAEDVSLVYEPRIVGTNHFVTCFKQNGNDKVFDSIGFNLGAFVDQIDKDKHMVDIAFTIEKVNRNGKTYPQIRLKDIKVKENENKIRKEKS